MLDNIVKAIGVKVNEKLWEAATDANMKSSAKNARKADLEKEICSSCYQPRKEGAKCCTACGNRTFVQKKEVIEEIEAAQELDEMRTEALWTLRLDVKKAKDFEMTLKNARYCPECKSIIDDDEDKFCAECSVEIRDGISKGDATPFLMANCSELVKDEEDARLLQSYDVNELIKLMERAIEREGWTPADLWGNPDDATRREAEAQLQRCIYSADRAFREYWRAETIAQNLDKMLYCPKCMMVAYPGQSECWECNSDVVLLPVTKQVAVMMATFPKIVQCQEHLTELQEGNGDGIERRLQTEAHERGVPWDDYAEAAERVLDTL